MIGFPLNFPFYDGAHKRHVREVRVVVDGFKFIRKFSSLSRRQRRLCGNAITVVFVISFLRRIGRGFSFFT